MIRSPRPAMLLALLAALFLGTGCTTVVPGAAEPDPEFVAAIGWVDQVCGALLPFIQTASVPPQLDPASDPATLLLGLSTYLGGASTSAGAAIDAMAAAGPSPVAGGDELVTGLTGTLTTFQTTLDGAKTQIDALDPNNPLALIETLPAAVAPLEQLSNLPDPTAGLQSSPELDQASELAANCKKVEQLTSG